jgi:transposase
VARVVAVDPNQFRVISHSVKETDPNGARNWALYLEKDLLPEVRMKDKTQAQLASLAQTRDTLVKLRTSLKNSAQHLASWAGLCPGNNESAGKKMSGTTRDGNKWLRRTPCQGSWAVARKKDRYLASQFRRVAARRGMEGAVMAVAHSMLIIAYTMLKTG